MAKVTITLTDNADKLNVRIESDPPFPGPVAECQDTTCAQNAGMFMLEALTKQMKKSKDEDDEDDEEA